MREVFAVLRKVILFYPINYSTVMLLRIFGFAGLGVLSGLLVKLFFDRVEEHSLTIGALWLLFYLLIAIPFVQAMLYSIDLSISYGWTEIIRSIFRRNLLRHVLKQPGASPLPIGHGMLMNLLREDIKTPESLLWRFPYFLAYIAFSFYGAFILSSIDGWAAVILFAPLPLAFIVVQWLTKQIDAAYHKHQQAADRVLGLLSDIFNYSQAIKINQAEAAFLARLRSLSEERARAGKRNAVLLSALDSIFENIVGLGTAALLLFIGLQIGKGNVSAGELTLFVFFLGYVSNLTRLFGTMLTGLKNCSVSLTRMRQIFGDEATAKLTANDSLYLDGAPTAAPTSSAKPVPFERVEVNGLSYRFPDSLVGLQDISFSLEKGSFTVITGKIGSGKTTLLRLLLGLLPKASGEIRCWNGERTNPQETPDIGASAVYIPQVPFLFSETIKENTLLGFAEEDDQLLKAVDLAMFTDDLERFPQGLNTPIGPKGVNLSGGQQQRVAAMRAFVRDAGLWVLDDMSSALDVDTEIRLWDKIHRHRIANGITCLVVTQKKFALQGADQILVLDGGILKAKGSLHELIDVHPCEEILNIYELSGATKRFPN